MTPLQKIFLPLAAAFLTAPLASCEERAAPNLPSTPMKAEAKDATEIPENHETITLGAGCFWCVEAVYQQLEGVYSVASGYMGGHVPNPTYEQVCSKTTGHIEVVQVKFDPEKLPTEDLLAWFWQLHDPTSKDQQGADVGPQYRSAIFYHTPKQLEIAKASMKAAQPDFPKPIVTELREAEKFYVAEDVHQDFYFQNKMSNGYCRAVITPKLRKLKLKE